MSSVKRIARNTSFLTVSQIISFAESFIYIALVARYLGPQGLGDLNFAVALTAIFSVLANFGLTTLTTREVARDKSKASKYAANVIPIQLLFALISVGMIVALVNALGYSQQIIYIVYILSIGMITSTLSTLFLAIFQAFEQLEFQSMVTIITSIVPLCAAMIAILLHLGVIVFALISLLTSALGLGYVYATCVRKFFVPRLEADFTFWRGALAEAWPMAGMAISIMIYFRIDVVMISLIHDTTAVGFYSVAYTLAEASTVVASVLVASLFPILSKMHQDSKQSFRYTCALTMRYLLYLALPIAFFVTLWSMPIILLLYGDKFGPSVAALQILIWAAAIMYITIVLGTASIANNLQKLTLKVTVMSIAVNVCLNVLLIPKFSFLGASFATVVTEAFGLVAGLFFLGRYGYAFGLKRASVPPIFGLAIIGVITALLLLENVPLTLITLIDLVVYGAVIYKFGINDDDKRLILGMLTTSKLTKAEM
jgi:O-antigen/teichoic acid export membrane protein